MLLLLLRGHGAGTVVVGSLPTVDAFDGVTGTDIDGRIPDQGSGVWEVVRGGATIVLNSARTTTAVDSIALIDVGSANYRMTLILVAGGSESDTWGVFRAKDADNFWQFRVVSGNLHLYDVTAGVLTNHGIVAGGLAHSITITVTASGDSITVSGGAVSIQVTSSIHNDATKVGFRGEGDGSFSIFNNLNVTALSADRRYPTGRAGKSQGVSGRADKSQGVSGRTGKSQGVTGRMLN